MTLLIISPDYASHLLPLATLGTAWAEHGERVVVATGAATAAIVESFGFERAHLQLARGSNPGVIRAEEQIADEDASLRGFFDATRRGPVETLAYQAGERLTDLMWQPVETASAVQRIVAEVQPDAIVVDHLAFSARLALTAAHIPYADVVLGHPSALPVGDEVYGEPPVWPRGMVPDEASSEPLRELCEWVSQSFTREWNTAMAVLDPTATPSTDAFAEHGDLLLYNYPEELADPDREASLPRHVYLGSAVRAEPGDPDVEAWMAATPHYVYVSFGSFLSVRSDVTARVVAALAKLGVSAAIALGSASLDDLGAIPDGWLVREFLPQVTLLGGAAAAVTHGGNNSVTEAMTEGVPLVVLPFSTDQFAGAAALERVGFGEVLAPNEASVDDLVAALGRVLEAGPRASGARRELQSLSERLRQRPGRMRAFEAVGSVAAAPAGSAQVESAQVVSASVESAAISSRIASRSPDAAR